MNLFLSGSNLDSSDQEMIAIGAAKILGFFVGSFPVIGSFSRTNINAGSGVRILLWVKFILVWILKKNGKFQAQFYVVAWSYYCLGALLMSLTILTPYFYFIPKSALAATIITAMLFMIESDLLRNIWRTKSIIKSIIIARFAQ